MDTDTLPLFDWARNKEDDFTGAVCWAIWKPKLNAYDPRQALVDIEDFERLSHLPWTIQKIGKSRKLRVVRPSGVYLARELMGFPKGMTVDHRDLNSLNDRRANLRVCTIAENNRNNSGYKLATRTSRYKGVQWIERYKVWIVICGPRGAKVNLGRFPTEVEAARAYNEYAKATYGEFAYLNPI